MNVCLRLAKRIHICRVERTTVYFAVLGLCMGLNVACSPAPLLHSDSSRLERGGEPDVSFSFSAQGGSTVLGLGLHAILNPAALMDLESAGKPVEAIARVQVTTPSGETLEGHTVLPIIGLIELSRSKSGARTVAYGTAGERLGNGFRLSRSESLLQMAREEGVYRGRVYLEQVSSESRRGLKGVRALGPDIYGRGAADTVRDLQVASAPTPGE